MKKQDVTIEPTWTEEFENLYILTYQILYRHAKLIFTGEEKVKELLILTYMEAYQRQNQLQKEKVAADWLMKRMDFLAETRLEATKEMLEASYIEEKMQSKEAKKETLSGLDEASILLEIEDRIGMMEDQEQSQGKSIAKTTVQGIFSLVLFFAAICVLFTGVWKVKHQLDVLQEPFERRFEELPENDFGMNGTAEKKNYVMIGDKVVYLSEVGQVLYSLPFGETDMAGWKPENPEIQKQGSWIYYLPCPERKDSKLSQVRPTLYHTLYRMKSDGSQMEIVAQEVDNYGFWNGSIYVSQYGRIQRIEADEQFEAMDAGIYAVEENDEIYLYDTLGRTIETEEDGSLRFEDRIFEMSSNRVENVRPAARLKGNKTYFLKKTEKGNAIYCSENGSEVLFETCGNTIDSFCIAGDWIYYCAYIRRGGSGAHYSELYRKSLVEDRKAEKLREEFTGRVRQMYYASDVNQIYADYIPKNWKNNHGVIAVISLSGQMSYLDDEALRKEVETTGNDMLEFVMIQDGDVYCYWKDCYWEKGEEPIAIWRKSLVIPDRNRIVMD